MSPESNSNMWSFVFWPRINSISEGMVLSSVFIWVCFQTSPQWTLNDPCSLWISYHTPSLCLWLQQELLYELSYVHNTSVPHINTSLGVYVLNIHSFSMRSTAVPLVRWAMASDLSSNRSWCSWQSDLIFLERSSRNLSNIVKLTCFCNNQQSPKHHFRINFDMWIFCKGRYFLTWDTVAVYDRINYILETWCNMHVYQLWSESKSSLHKPELTHP